MGDSDSGRERSPTEVVGALLTAISDGRVGDVLALVDPRVVWVPAVRPGLTMYKGRAGVAQYMTDLRAAFGRFRVVMGSIAVEGSGDDGAETQVTARFGGVREVDGAQVAMPSLTAVFTVRGGLVTSMESQQED